MLKQDRSGGGAAAAEAVQTTGRVVTVEYPNHLWHADLTVVPTRSGFWVPWLPFAMPQRWPFCWWMAVAADHVSRLVVGFALFLERPTSAEVCVFLDRAIRACGNGPKHIVTDKGSRFFCEGFLGWCERRSIRPRFGAVGEHGSIAVVERFIRSMKSGFRRRVMVPFRMAAMRQEIAFLATWYNEYRPHSGLDGRTPLEVHQGLSPANEALRVRPRSQWPCKSWCAGPVVPVKGRTGARLQPVVTRFENRPHLPGVALRRAG